LAGPTLANFFPGCEGDPVEVTTEFGGTAVFRADGSYEVSQNRSLTTVANVPVECLAGLPCDSLNDESNTTAATDTHCVWTSSTSGERAHQGTFSVADGVSTLSPEGEAPRTSNYCIEGDLLTVQAIGPDGQIGAVLLWERAE